MSMRFRITWQYSTLRGPDVTRNSFWCGRFRSGDLHSVEYTFTGITLKSTSYVSWDCISRLYLCKGVRPPPTSVLDGTLNCIWCRGSNPWALGILEYRFIAIIPRSTRIQGGSTYWNPIYGSNKTVWPFNCEQKTTDAEFLVVGWVLWHINFCWLFNAKSIFM